MKQHWKGCTLLAPVPPALVTVGSMENSNIITVAWTGILSSNPPKTYISVRPERFSYAMIEQTREFVINLTTEELVFAADLCGFKSGRDCDKFALSGLSKEQCVSVGCPAIAQSPLSIECKVTDCVPLGSHTMFIADIVGVLVEEKYIDDKGKLNLQQSRLASYCHGSYYGLGKKIGKMGFSINPKLKNIYEKNQLRKGRE